MSFTDALDGDAQAVSDTIAKVTAAFTPRAPFGSEHWTALAEAGLFDIPNLFPETARTVIAAAMEALGRYGAASQAAAAFAFLAVAPPDLAASVTSGAARVCLGRPPYMPAGRRSDVFMSESEGQAVLLGVDHLEPVSTLSDESWVRLTGAPELALGPFHIAHDAYDLAIGAWLAGAGLGLLELAAEHVRTRRQFGRAIGEFQAVAAPLARASVGLDAARTLTLTACASADKGDARLARIARASSARAALRAALVAHQALGALGMVDEGPVQAVSKRIRQVASQFPFERHDALDEALDPGRSLTLLALSPLPREPADA
jgi:hypothetical protein